MHSFSYESKTQNLSQSDLIFFCEGEGSYAGVLIGVIKCAN